MDAREGIFKERRVLRQDKTKHHIHARRESVKLMLKAMKYVRQSCVRLEVVHSGKEIHGNFDKGLGLPVGAGVKGVYQYIDEVKNMSLPKGLINTMTKIFNNFLTLYKEIEYGIQESAKKAVGMKNLNDIYGIFHAELVKWDSVVKVAESVIIAFSESVEDYYQEWDIYHIFGDLKRPKVKSC